ncbi:MAG: phosphotransferase family protein [Anaerolineae bacterium]|nr:phosphotransferase family protein [Anaerolineae bacterium]
MSQPPTTHQLDQLARAIAPASVVRRAWELTGGVSARLTALEYQQPDGALQTVVIRQHGAADRLANPHVARHEFQLMQALHAAGLPVPAPVHLDETTALLSTPFVVVQYIPAQPLLNPPHLDSHLLQLAAHLAHLHSLNWQTLDLSFLTRLEDALTRDLARVPAQPDESLDESRIRAALAACRPLPARNPLCLLHGDFWPGNLLFDSAAHLAAIIDWEDAALGDPLADLATARLELLWAFGLDAMTRFTRHYQSLTTFDFRHLPYWDLVAALSPAGRLHTWGLEPAVEAAMRLAHHHFVAAALRDLEPLYTKKE